VCHARSKPGKRKGASKIDPASWGEVARIAGDASLSDAERLKRIQALVPPAVSPIFLCPVQTDATASGRVGS